MTTPELTEKFLLWFQEKYPDARIYRNNSGIAWREGKNGKKYPIKFGIPLPRGKGKGAGGSDYIAFIPYFYELPDAYDIATHTIEKAAVLKAMFFEMKLIGDEMKEEQIKFANQMTKIHGEYYGFRK